MSAVAQIKERLIILFTLAAFNITFLCFRDYDSIPAVYVVVNSVRANILLAAIYNAGKVHFYEWIGSCSAWMSNFLYLFPFSLCGVQFQAEQPIQLFPILVSSWRAIHQHLSCLQRLLWLQCFIRRSGHILRRVRHSPWNVHLSMAEEDCNQAEYQVYPFQSPVYRGIRRLFIHHSCILIGYISVPVSAVNQGARVANTKPDRPARPYGDNIHSQYGPYL